MNEPKPSPRLSGEDALRITNLILSASHHPIAASPIELDPEYVRRVTNEVTKRLERELLTAWTDPLFPTPRARTTVGAIPAELVAIERYADRVVRTVRLL